MVSIDTVYQRVLAIANKEQRGYITPQEFNLFANQAQMEIFEQYFYDMNQFGKVPGNSTEYSDMLDLLKEKISIFKKEEDLNVVGGVIDYPSNAYRIGELFHNFAAFGQRKIQQVDKKELNLMKRSSLLKPSRFNPVYTDADKKFTFHGLIDFDLNISYIKKPITADWGYNVIGEHAINNPSTSVDFELHESEETSLVMKILSLAGITLKDITLYQAGQNSENAKIQQEKQ
jgi:hypothetical protein